MFFIEIKGHNCMSPLTFHVSSQPVHCSINNDNSRISYVLQSLSFWNSNISPFILTECVNLNDIEDVII
uniref:Uncharacterized protein n=1 Tax=Arundo donax TaxID=35708 RepID=A0A0A9AKS4_ARUDO